MTKAFPHLDAVRHLVSHDFFPDFSRRVRAAVASPLGVLIVAAAFAVACGLVLHPRMFALAGGLGGVVAVGVCWPWLTVRGVRAVVAFDQGRITEGETASVRAEVTNYLPWPAWGLTLADESGTFSIRLAGIGPAARAVARWTVTPDRRGVYPRARLDLRCAFPFGLWQARRPVRVDAPLLVWPRTLPVGPAPADAGTEHPDGQVARNRVGGTGDVLGVRPYRRGDSPRRIHWPQSARHDRLIVCEVQTTSRPTVFLVLDADPTAHTPGPDGSREWAIRAVASLVAGWLEAGALVGAAWAGTYLPPGAGRGQAVRVLDALARLPDDSPEPSADVLNSALTAGQEGIRIVVTTDAGLDRLGRVGGVRFAVLERTGFGGDRLSRSCDEGPIRAPVRPWLSIPGRAGIAHALRAGWTEAKHGS
jgi:uncharacterized protein (DUF58 family)